MLENHFLQYILVRRWRNIDLNATLPEEENWHCFFRDECVEFVFFAWVWYFFTVPMFSRETISRKKSRIVHLHLWGEYGDQVPVCTGLSCVWCGFVDLTKKVSFLGLGLKGWFGRWECWFKRKAGGDVFSLILSWNWFVSIWRGVIHWQHSKPMWLTRQFFFVQDPCILSTPHYSLCRAVHVIFAVPVSRVSMTKGWMMDLQLLQKWTRLRSTMRRTWREGWSFKGKKMVNPQHVHTSIPQKPRNVPLKINGVLKDVFFAEIGPFLGDMLVFRGVTKRS